MNDIVLDVAEVQKQYGRQPALRGVSLQVQRGELFGLLGPNGAGKTTLLSILSGLARCDSGSVRLFGEALIPQSAQLRKRIGLATQDLAIYPELTARENLLFFGRLYNLPSGKLRSRSDELLNAVGLTERADDQAGTFSGGMKRRLNLAVSVIHEPDILYLDEPTTGVDPQSRHHIFEQVRRLNEAGLTVIYTSHYMEEVQSLCPRIAILDQGQIQACDTLPNLLQKLNAVAHLELASIPPGLLERIQPIPGVISCVCKGNTVEVTAKELAPLLPKVLMLCTELGTEVQRMELNQPSLERVFLHLTGHALRD
jgi:ABC-2 type transport system ATP-binding protein